MNNDTEKVVTKPETLGAIMAERVKEMGGVVPLHKMNRKARRAHYAQTGERVVGSNKPKLNPNKISENVRLRLYRIAQSMGLRYHPHYQQFVDSQGKARIKIDFNKEVEAYKKTFE